MTVSTRPATTAMGFFMTLMTSRPALKLGLPRARKPLDENGNTRQRTWLSTKESAIINILSSKNML